MDKTAIVTGAARGLGAAICVRAVQAGYRVGVPDLDLADCEAFIRTLPGTGPVALQADVEDVANAVLWLASDEAAYVTGHQLVIDGGVVHSVPIRLPRNAN